MAKVYHRKKTSTKLIEGAIAGLVGGVGAVAVLVLLDLIVFAGRWWYTSSLIGSLVSGTPEENIAAPSAGLPAGILIQLVLFTLIGLGYIMYLPLFRRFKLNPILGGVIYAVVMGLLVFFFFFGAIRPAVAQMANIFTYLISNVIGGAVMGWWSARSADQ